ncbi:amidohydrolase [Leptospira levettii]|uniref:Amidohydrolase n=1 Tax=Leptospira levettii TaxID=2023178 RepID=A0ABY2MHF0_9LEPT|nr:amidohydrolase [Leptospira levettii]MCW7497304.1 amidohydrolase [Leptospira levettii]TGL66909.1 amidohydrolase [Leptospira levettii]TGM33161.1 amidohydrolase [Leptospira levettii]TGM43556.1 amidohydrolase [Leptospira levettii]TGM93895.1 amidohydrolase [Leptospira levettii]
MAVIKIAIYQKNLHKRFTHDEIVKIQQSKAHFLLLPEGYPHLFQSVSPKEGTKHEKEYQDHILEISEKFTGVILGGSHYRNNESGKLVAALPIVQSLVLVDFYEKKTPNPSVDIEVKEGLTESIFIMGGLRFGLLLGEDIQNKSIWEEFKKENIEIIFHLDTANPNRTYKDDLSDYENLAKEKNIHLIRVCGPTEGKPARSLYASPSGINWKVGKIEEDKDVFKTLSVNVMRSYLL